MPAGQEINADQQAFAGVDGLTTISVLRVKSTTIANPSQSSVITDVVTAGISESTKPNSTPTIGINSTTTTTTTTDNYVFVPQHVVDSNPSSLSSSTTSSSSLSMPQHSSSTSSSSGYLNVKQQALPTKTPVNTPTSDMMVGLKDTTSTTATTTKNSTTNIIEAAIDFMIADQQQQQHQGASTSTPIKINGGDVGESHHQQHARLPVSSASCNEFTTITTERNDSAIPKSQSEDNIIIQQHHDTEQSRDPNVIEHPASPVGELDRDWRIRYRQFLACMMSEPVLIEYFENAFDMMNAIERYKVEFEFKQIQSP